MRTSAGRAAFPGAAQQMRLNQSCPHSRSRTSKRSCVGVGCRSGLVFHRPWRGGPLRAENGAVVARRHRLLLGPVGGRGSVGRSELGLWAFPCRLEHAVSLVSPVAASGATTFESGQTLRRRGQVLEETHDEIIARIAALDVRRQNWSAAPDCPARTAQVIECKKFSPTPR